MSNVDSIIEEKARNFLAKLENERKSGIIPERNRANLPMQVMYIGDKSNADTFSGIFSQTISTCWSDCNNYNVIINPTDEKKISSAMFGLPVFDGEPNVAEFILNAVIETTETDYKKAIDLAFSSAMFINKKVSFIPNIYFYFMIDCDDSKTAHIISEISDHVDSKKKSSSINRVICCLCGNNSLINKRFNRACEDISYFCVLNNTDSNKADGLDCFKNCFGNGNFIKTDGVKFFTFASESANIDLYKYYIIAFDAFSDMIIKRMRESRNENSLQKSLKSIYEEEVTNMQKAIENFTQKAKSNVMYLRQQNIICHQPLTLDELDEKYFYGMLKEYFRINFEKNVNELKINFDKEKILNHIYNEIEEFGLTKALENIKELKGELEEVLKTCYEGDNITINESSKEGYINEAFRLIGKKYEFTLRQNLAKVYYDALEEKNNPVIIICDILDTMESYTESRKRELVLDSDAVSKRISSDVERAFFKKFSYENNRNMLLNKYDFSSIENYINSVFSDFDESIITRIISSDMTFKNNVDESDESQLEKYCEMLKCSINNSVRTDIITQERSNLVAIVDNNNGCKEFIDKLGVKYGAIVGGDTKLVLLKLTSINSVDNIITAK